SVGLRSSSGEPARCHSPSSTFRRPGKCWPSLEPLLSKHTLGATWMALVEGFAPGWLELVLLSILLAGELTFGRFAIKFRTLAVIKCSAEINPYLGLWIARVFGSGGRLGYP